MEFFVKQFNELSPEELYEIIKTRFDIFVIEQNIMCRDLDDVDKIALHVFCRDADGRVTGYYAKQGFEVTSDIFLEDTIPHVEMRRSL